MANPVNRFHSESSGNSCSCENRVGWTVRVTHGDASFEWPHRYAAAAEINWTNQK
jgi:hypothetical protein